MIPYLATLPDAFDWSSVKTEGPPRLTMGLSQWMLDMPRSYSMEARVRMPACIREMADEDVLRSRWLEDLPDYARAMRATGSPALRDLLLSGGATDADMAALGYRIRER